jgi:hypothetical protein
MSKSKKPGKGKEQASDEKDKNMPVILDSFIRDAGFKIAYRPKGVEAIWEPDPAKGRPPGRPIDESEVIEQIKRESQKLRQNGFKNVLKNNHCMWERDGRVFSHCQALDEMSHDGVL